MSVNSNQTWTDGDGIIWSNSSSGYLFDGTSNAVDRAANWDQFGFSSSGELSMDGRMLTMDQINSGNFSLLRTIYVSPNDGFVRVVDFVTNNGGSRATFNYTQTNNLWSSFSNISTSNGDSVLDAQDNWFATEPTSGSNAGLTVVFDGEGGLAPSSAGQLDGDDLQFGFSLNLAVGETQAVATFLTQHESLAEGISDGGNYESAGSSFLYGLDEDQIDAIANFDLSGIVTFSYAGTNGLDFLVGDSFDETFDGFAGNDILSGEGGNDIIRGQEGNDTLIGGAGDDEIWGGLDSDTIQGGLGNDFIFGDEETVLQTSASTVTIPSTGELFSVSITLPDTTTETSIPISGYVSRTPVLDDQINVVFVIDESDSTGFSFVGSTAVPDINEDGLTNTILDAEILGVENLINNLIGVTGAENIDAAIVGFDSSAETYFSGPIFTNNNGDPTLDIIEAARSIRDSGSTRYEAGLQEAISFFNNQSDGQNYVFFLSDGENNTFASFTSEVSTLLDSNGISATIRSFGVGSDSSPDQLDLLDDGIDNGSETIVVDPSQLSTALIDPGISQSDVERVDLYLNGSLVASIPGTSLLSTPLGLQFEFQAVLDGLLIGQGDVVQAYAYATDTDASSVSTFQIVEEVASPAGGADYLIGGEGNDVIIAGDGNDVVEGGIASDRIFGDAGNDALFGGAGNDLIEGGFGSDFIYGDDGIDTLRGGADVDFMWGGFGADTMSGGEDNDWLRGESGDDILSGDSGVDVLFGGTGNDLMNGGNDTDTFYGEVGNDIINGDAGGDVAFGQDGNDSINGGAGGDFLFGGEGQDIINGGTENDLIWGNLSGPGDGVEDIFVFEDNWGFDAIYDFEVGIDQISMSSVTGLTQYSDLTVFNGGANVTVVYDGNAITLYGVTLAELNTYQTDFDFG